MRSKNLVQIRLPGIFVGSELMEMFRNAASFQQDESIRWEYQQEQYEPGVRLGGRRYFLVSARPVFRNVPNRFRRGVLGQRETWAPRFRGQFSDESEVKIGLYEDDRFHGLDDQGQNLELFMGMKIDRFETDGSHTNTRDLDHPALRPYRAGFERIRANFLSNLIAHSLDNPGLHVERMQPSVNYYENKLVGEVDQEAA